MHPSILNIKFQIKPIYNICSRKDTGKPETQQTRKPWKQFFIFYF